MRLEPVSRGICRAAWTSITGRRTRALPASELLLFPKLCQLDVPDLHVVVISRSGKTSEAVRAADFLTNKLHLPTIGITCAVDSELSKFCDLTVALPAAGWSILGSPGSVTGYAFRDPGRTGAIASVRLRADRLQLKGGGPSWTFDLSTPPERRVAVRLALGTERPWCAAAPAKVSGNPPSSAASDTASRFVGQPKTAAPLVCPPTP